MQKMIMITDFKMLIWRQARATSDNLLYRNIFLGNRFGLK